MIRLFHYTSHGGIVDMVIMLIDAICVIPILVLKYLWALSYFEVRTCALNVTRRFNNVFNLNVSYY